MNSVDLGIDDALLSSCVQCGLCLPHCPTYRVTGEEERSPRGRIAAMREAQRDGVEPDAAWIDAIDSCLQCRGCEPACPSGVRFGSMMESTRAALASDGTHRAPPWVRAGLRALDRPLLLRAGVLAAGWAARATRSRPAVAARVPVPPTVTARRPRLRPSTTAGEAVWLFTGCVMDAAQRQVHADTITLLQWSGLRVRIARGGSGCCGALAGHLGEADRARRQARRVLARFPGQDPIVVGAAGCGAQLRDLGHQLGGPQAQRFARRIVDVTELLSDRLDRLPPPTMGAAPVRVAVQEPCHLRHVQRVRRLEALLAPYAEVVGTDDDGRCCGAGGAYSFMRPGDAAAVRSQKLEALALTGAPLVATVNPGCEFHLAAGGAPVVHVCTLLVDLIGRGSPSPSPLVRAATEVPDGR